MKPYRSLFMLTFLMLLLNNLFGQKPIPYGSNNGKTVIIFDKKVYYEEYGTGAPLILLEGGLKNISNFSRSIPTLSKYFRVITPDDPGQGRSQALDTMTYDLLAEYVSKLIDLLKLDSAYVMGWSDGGIAALILATKRPDKIKKVIAVGANYAKTAYVTYDSTTDTLELITPDYQLPADDQKWVDGYFVANKNSWRKIINDREVMWYQPYYFPKELFNEMKIPIMIVSGDRDIIKLEHSIEMYRLIKGSQLCILPNTSHDVFGESPGLINKTAIDFFQK